MQSLYEYVDSRANIADGGAHVDSSVLGMPFVIYSMLKWPDNVLTGDGLFDFMVPPA